MTRGAPTEPTSSRHAAQASYAYRFDWGLDGLRALAPYADLVVVVDVLRFTSAVSAAVEAGAAVLPYPWTETGAAAYAAEHDAVLAGRREDGVPSLSPTDLLRLPSGTRIVLASPNGAAIACAAAELTRGPVLAGCLRNATVTAQRARCAVGDRGTIAVIASGERWGDTDGPLRPAVEDLLGAGAILAALDPSGAVGAPRCSPEARTARAAFGDARPRLYDHLLQCASGQELVERGWEDDVATSAALDVAGHAAELIQGAFVAV